MTGLKNKHYMNGSKENKAWNQMKQRCYNPNNPDYRHYGGRGIKVCDLWTASFSNFFEDMGFAAKGTSLDRIDVNGNYCKENCRWATFSEQAVNRRMKSTNSSGVTGVSYRKSNGKWRAYISVEKKQMFLGDYETFEGAVDARMVAEKKYHCVI